MVSVKDHLKAAQYLSESLDSKFKVGPWSFGLDPIIGLIPIAGDIATTAVSLYIVWIGVQMRLPSDKIAQMMGNVIFDFLLDFIPILGQIADFAFKSNQRNLKILMDYASAESDSAPVDIIDAQIVR